MEKIPFVIGTTSMVFGPDLLHNVRRLAARVQFVEIVLFQTPDLHNLPSAPETAELKRIAAGEGLRYSVHLPASLEPASPDRHTRETSRAEGLEISRRCAEFDPEHFILHLPFSKPTLVPIPDFYFHEKQPRRDWDDWTGRATEALGQFQRAIAAPERLLVENINYSPRFLAPFLEANLCRLCLDIGHLLLGQEPVVSHLEQFRVWIREIHLHGVSGYNEHLSLEHVPVQRLTKWLRVLREQDYSGLITLELFDPEGFQVSLQLLLNRLAA